MENRNKNEKLEKVQINKKEVRFQLVTGSNWLPVILINEQTWKKIYWQPLLTTEDIDRLVFMPYVAERNLNFCLARNLIWPLESPKIFNQSGWLVLLTPKHISKQHRKLKKTLESLSCSEILKGNGRLFVCSWITVASSTIMRRAI